MMEVRQRDDEAEGDSPGKHKRTALCITCSPDPPGKKATEADPPGIKATDDEDEENLKKLLQAQTWMPSDDDDEIYVKYHWESPRSRNRTAAGTSCEGGTTKVKSMPLFRDDDTDHEQEEDTANLLSDDISSNPSPSEPQKETGLSVNKEMVENLLPKNGFSNLLRSWLPSKREGKSCRGDALDSSSLIDYWKDMEGERQLAFDLDSIETKEDDEDNESSPPWMIQLEELLPLPLSTCTDPDTSCTQQIDYGTDMIMTMQQRKSSRYSMTPTNAYIVRRKKKQNNPWTKEFAGARDFRSLLPTVMEMPSEEDRCAGRKNEGEMHINTLDVLEEEQQDGKNKTQPAGTPLSVEETVMNWLDEDEEETENTEPVPPPPAAAAPKSYWKSRTKADRLVSWVSASSRGKRYYSSQKSVGEHDEHQVETTSSHESAKSKGSSNSTASTSDGGGGDINKNGQAAAAAATTTTKETSNNKSLVPRIVSWVAHHRGGKHARHGSLGDISTLSSSPSGEYAPMNDDDACLPGEGSKKNDPIGNITTTTTTRFDTVLLPCSIAENIEMGEI